MNATGKRFDDDTTITELLAAVAPELARLEDRDEMTAAHNHFGAACEFVRRNPESQTAADLLAWAHGQSAGGAVEHARAEKMEEWIAPEDMAAYEALEASA